MKSTAAVVRGRRFLKSSRGANLVEYIILVGVIAIIGIAGFKALGQSVTDKAEAQSSVVKGLPSDAPGTSGK